MEQDSNHSVLCKMGCGFFGNNSFDGMCSKCYKDYVKRTQQSSPTAGRSSPGNGACGTTSVPLNTTQITHPTATTSTVAQVTPPSPIPTNNDVCRTPEKAGCSSVEETSSPSSQASLADSSDSPGKLKKRNRCYSCRKKVGLTGFECRCGGLFCGHHRYSDKHNCTYDYKADARQQIAKANPVIVGEKIKKI